MVEITLTLEDCKNIIETIDLANGAVAFSAVHSYNPFDHVEEKRLAEMNKTFAKIQEFVKEHGG